MTLPLVSLLFERLIMTGHHQISFSCFLYIICYHVLILQIREMRRVNSTSENMPRVHLYQDSNCSNLFQSHDLNLLHSAKTAPEKEAKLEV